MNDFVEVRQFEFDQSGYVTYHKENEKTLVLPFVAGDEVVEELKLYHYNEAKRIIYNCTENSRYLAEYLFKFDKNQNLLEESWKFDQETVQKTIFKWKKGKMVKSKSIFSRNFDEYEDAIYNTDGKIIEYKSDDYRDTYEYQKNGDTTFLVTTSFKNDTITWTVSRYFNLGNSEPRLTSHLILNEAGFKEKEVFVVYDEHGNTTDYRYQDFENFSNDGEAPKMNNSKIYEIKNEYDERVLLVRQLYYLEDIVSKQMILQKALHYSYETTPLANKIEKGSIEKTGPDIQLR